MAGSPGPPVLALLPLWEPGIPLLGEASLVSGGVWRLKEAQLCQQIAV